MRVLFVSQCSKNAIIETRRIIDQFAERKGDSVWETNITQQGLDTVKKLLKSTARRNTAVACHLFRGRFQSELLWIVGNSKKFGRNGNVPTNVTCKDILRIDDEDNWSSGEAIAIMATLAGLFHDFGKAKALFQNKLKKEAKKNYEPFRHEWVSLLLFKQFVGTSSDREWLEKLSQINPELEINLLKDFPQDFDALKANPLQHLPPLAKFIGWLILSHHRLPVYTKNQNESEPRLTKIDDWMDSKRFTASWNSIRCNDDTWTKKDLAQITSFPEGTPIRSTTWCKAAQRAARRALNSFDLLQRNWFKDRFCMHLTRAALMLSDHNYSAGDVHLKYQDPLYHAYANTEKKAGDSKRQLKQHLDEHNIGVARNAFFISKAILKLRDTLPVVSRHKVFKKRSVNHKFSWQDKAFDLATTLSEASDEKGFFGVNLASTGCGKTLANARIMYGLSNEKKGCRFSIALGLRILTLQTGVALREKLFLNNDELAVVIGSKAVQELYEHTGKNTPNTSTSPIFNHSDESLIGSESIDSLNDDEHFVLYEGDLDVGHLKEMFKSSPDSHKLISAPILVSTIDHLITATEGCRGGKQIPSIIRLLTSDLVLDEPDDFDIADLPALCRLVNFAGVFGSKVLLSSATLPPSIIEALFDAYSTGRESYNNATENESSDADICCAWFDEFGVASSTHINPDTYMDSHREFISKRIDKLEKLPILRPGTLVSVGSKSSGAADAKTALANTIHESIFRLHDQHHQIHPESKQQVSIGLVRMANINPMISVVKEVLNKQVKDDYCIHFCVYHSKFPMLIRSKIEEVLDKTLTRHDPDKLWEIPEIQSALKDKPETRHIFVVFATSVAEVGRDHDYDWAIAEPSSMRSIIQLAGRIQRHRKITPSHPNIIILQNNLKGLKGLDVAYTRPGFESKEYHLIEKDLSTSLRSAQYGNITSIPRLQVNNQLDFRGNLVDLEHKQLQVQLFGVDGNGFYAKRWWDSNADWCGELQRISRFRSSVEKETEYVCYVPEDGKEACIHEFLDCGGLVPAEESNFINNAFHYSPRTHPWIQCNVNDEIQRLSKEMNITARTVSLKFAKFSLRNLEDGLKWYNDPILGFYVNE